MESEPEIKILCSTCYDGLECERILSIIPQSKCELCGRGCLGYQTEVPGLDSEARAGVES